jgi:hypothetical protein
MELTYFMVLGMGWFSNFKHLMVSTAGGNIAWVRKYLFGPCTMLINMGV